MKLLAWSPTYLRPIERTVSRVEVPGLSKFFQGPLKDLSEGMRQERNMSS